MNSSFLWARALSIARKETRHILRDPFTLGLALGLPVILVSIFGFAIDLNVKNVTLAVADRDQSRVSRELVSLFSNSGYFKTSPAPIDGRLTRTLDSERTKAVLVIEPGYGSDALSGRTGLAQVLLDGSDNSVAGTISGYIRKIEVLMRKRLGDTPPEGAILLAPRFLFNPELNSRWFILPGLAVVVVGIFSVLLTSLTVAREWENGSMELLLSTPVKASEIIIGKLGPYILLNLLSIAFVYLVARLVFDIPFRGSHLLFLFASLLFLATTLSQGLVISVTVRQQQLAMQLAIMSGMLPSLMLSGFTFPVESMPAFFQWLTSILSARWFMVICRGLFLKGAGLGALAVPIGAMALIGLVLVGKAVHSFKMDLEHD
jgi:ABC-2 type transport system permease protein